MRSHIFRELLISWELRRVENESAGIDSCAVDKLEMGINIGKKPSDGVDAHHRI